MEGKEKHLENITRKLEQFNTRTKILLSKNGLGPDLANMLKDLGSVQHRVENINSRVSKLKASVNEELLLSIQEEQMQQQKDIPKSARLQ